MSLQEALKGLTGGRSPLGPGTLPGFLTQFGLNLTSQVPTGNIFQTAATAAKEPFQTFQAAELADEKAKQNLSRMGIPMTRRITLAISGLLFNVYLLLLCPCAASLYTNKKISK